jgi:hypothetical protein
MLSTTERQMKVRKPPHAIPVRQQAFTLAYMDGFMIIAWICVGIIADRVDEADEDSL